MINQIFLTLDAEKKAPPIKLTIQDLILKVRYLDKDVVKRDCSCDSRYILSTMDRVGKAMRKLYHWIDINVVICLVMNNAGGHGTDNTIIKYTRLLKEAYNITIIHQIPRSPYTNALDLRVWTALQSDVEKKHYMRRCNINSLVATVNETWATGTLDKIITNVFEILK